MDSRFELPAVPPDLAERPACCVHILTDKNTKACYEIDKNDEILGPFGPDVDPLLAGQRLVSYMGLERYALVSQMRLEPYGKRVPVVVYGLQEKHPVSKKWRSLPMISSYKLDLFREFEKNISITEQPKWYPRYPL